MHIDRHIAVSGGWVAGPAFAVTMMAAPGYLHHLSQTSFALLFWGGLVVFFVTPIFILLAHAKEQRTKKLFPLLTMALGLVILGAGAAWYFWPDQASEAESVATVAKDVTPNPPPPSKLPVTSMSNVRGPTFEATGDSKIDITGGTIPGDLPFQFGVARDHSAIIAPGLTVTRTDNGYQMSTTPVEQTFPPPIGTFNSLDNNDLKSHIADTSAQLRNLQKRIDEKMQQFYQLHQNTPLPRADKSTDDERRTLNEEFRKYWEPFVADYDNRFQDTAFELACVALRKIGKLESGTQSVQLGGSLLFNKAFSGPRPASSIADFLDYISNHLPKE